MKLSVLQTDGTYKDVSLTFSADDTIDGVISKIKNGEIFDTLFSKLKASSVDLSACILKCNMVLAGKQFHTESTPEEVGAATAEVLRQHLPDNLAGVVFLSGGQTPEQATANLKAIQEQGPFPWPVTFSFARALQEPALQTWQGDNQNIPAAQTAFKQRLIANTKLN